jgi:abortive infection bacteriophage resistance protein
LKEFLSLNQQIHKLQQKKVTVDDEIRAQQFLRDNNYYNVISCSKIKFITSSRDDGHYEYTSSTFSEWIDYYKKDILVSLFLMKAMIHLEKTLNSRTAYYISYLLEFSQELPIVNQSELTEIIQAAKVIHLPTYSGHETWKYITKMEFGKMKQLIYYLYNQQDIPLLKEHLNLILDDTGLNINKLRVQLNELNNLRNHLFHFTPLNVFLCHGIIGTKNQPRYSNTRRKKAVSFIFNLNPNPEIKNILLEFFNNSDRFIKTKNNQQ